MKRSTERRILLAILLSALIPVLAMGLLTAAAVLRMGRQVEGISQRSRHAQLRSDLHLRCREKGEELGVFLRGRADDLRSLALLPPTPANYRSFHWSTLAPLWATGEGGREARIWLPLYLEIAFLSADGKEVVAVRKGEPVRPADLGQHPEWVVPRNPGAERSPLLPPVVIEVLPGPSPASASAAFDGVLALSLPVGEAQGERPGTVRAVLDPRHLAARLLPPPRGAGPAATPLAETRGVFLFRADGTAALVPSPEAPGGPSIPGLTSEPLAAALEAVRRGTSGTLAVLPDTPRVVFAFAPILGFADPAEAPRPLGGVLLAVDLGTLPPVPATAQAVAALTRHLTLQLGGLSLAAALSVVLAALLVARRMTRPWTRLQEKARTLAGATPEADAVGEISRSFDSLVGQVAVHAGRVRASKRRLDQFVEMNPDGIAVTDPRGRILHCNRALCQMTRRAPNELMGHDVRRLWARETDWDEMLRHLRAAGRLKSYEGELRRGDGASFPALLTLRLHGHGTEESIDLIARDISEWKEIQRRDRTKTETLFRVYGELSKAHLQLRSTYAEVEEQVRAQTTELRQAYDALQASDQVKTEFLMNMSHELRTPLNCIIGYSEAMIEGLDGPVSGEQSDSLKRIAESGRRLLRLIENLLDLSRIEAGRMAVACVETRLEDAVEDVLHQARSLIGERPIQLQVELDAAALPPLWADPDRLRQVLFNLVGNALKFTARGTVQIGARQLPDGTVEVRVSDTGPGIPSQKLGAIFDRFVQLPGAAGTGAGLGLAICRELVDQMGGHLRVESELGSGSTFAFTLATAHPSGQLALPFPGPESCQDTHPAR